MRTFDSLKDALEDLVTRGYTEDFDLECDCLVSQREKLRLHPEDFNIDEFYRFEGDSNPDDSSVIFAISSNQGVRGVLIDAYGVYAENLTPEMSKKLTERIKQ
ncbi:MAG TPA: phosphoribosylpyrophosphate synthetase [Chitinophagaceae bacterium]|jgi:hypothetical protein|nr:phosphoribosylpyrophosphate synthetase [Chitinophagaceae bacterium]